MPSYFAKSGRTAVTSPAKSPALRYSAGVIPPPGPPKPYIGFAGADNRAAGVPQTADPSDQSFECVPSTESRALIYDAVAGEVVEEILIAAGGDFPKQIPLLDNHSRYSTQQQLGCARDFRLDGYRWLCRCFCTRGVPESEAAFKKVIQGHLTDVSIGYFVRAAVTIPPRTTKTVDGRSWTALNVPLRISTKWSVIELSLTPIGADTAAKVREHEQAVRESRPKSFFR